MAERASRENPKATRAFLVGLVAHRDLWTGQHHPADTRQMALLDNAPKLGMVNTWKD